MNRLLAQAILVAIVAGITTVMLSGVLTPNVAPLVMLSLLAPAPLFIAGFGWHPLVAALGGLIAALIAHVTIGLPAGLVVALLFGLPAYAITEYAQRRFSDYSGRPERDGIDLGMIAMTLMIYLALVVTISAIIVEPDYAALQARLRRSLEAAMRVIASSSGSNPAMDFSSIATVMAGIMLPLGTLVSFVTIVISTSFALFVTERATRLGYARPELKRFRLPGGGLILLGIAIFLGMREGYLGLFAEIIVVALVVAFVLQGLAVVHVRTLAFGNRGLLLGAVWGAMLLVTVIAAPIALGIGMADHLFNFRRGRI